MDVLILATDWGFEGSKDELCKRVKKEGYDGLEIWWPANEVDQKDLYLALQKYELKIGFLCGGTSSDFATHEAEFKQAVIGASSLFPIKPLYINCHSGRDYFTFDQNAKLITFTLEQEQKTGIDILHETHRGRMCFAAPVTKEFLLKFPKMKLTLDISHWTNVHESMLEDQKESVALALQRTGHIHARIGHQEGPQVNDPRAPEWKSVVDQHLLWWDTVIAHRIETGKKQMTILTEFGPTTYMPTLPYTCQPVANQWDINVYMLNLLKKRYTI